MVAGTIFLLFLWLRTDTMREASDFSHQEAVVPCDSLVPCHGCATLLRILFVLSQMHLTATFNSWGKDDGGGPEKWLHSFST